MQPGQASLGPWEFPEACRTLQRLWGERSAAGGRPHDAAGAGGGRDVAWRFVTDPLAPAGGYLRGDAVAGNLPVSAETSGDDSRAARCGEGDAPTTTAGPALDQDAATASPGPASRRCLWQLSVCYSETYMAPELYFLACTEDGVPLPWQDTESLLGPSYREEAARPDADGAFLHPARHPRLPVTMFRVHPCQTAWVVGLLLAQGADGAVADQTHPHEGYMRAWASVYLAVLGLSPPMEPEVEERH